jgi:hypothetical protein
MLDVVSPLDGFTSPMRSGLESLFPLRLFSSGEQGVWYDPSDMATLFQDEAGTTPVTALEQPVGRMLDKSGNGNHATQATDIRRPTLSARFNLLLDTETLATQNVVTLAASYRLRFTGAGSITLSGTATGAYNAGAHTITCTAGTLTLTVSGAVTQADLRLISGIVGLPVYQRISTATDYDATGFPRYLRFDGTDDGMLTSAIDFSATDKVSIFAGVTKLSDAQFYAIADFSSSPDTTAQTFSLGSSSAQGSPSRSTWASTIRGNGTNRAVAAAGIFTAPHTAVLNVAYDLAGVTNADEQKTRVNQSPQTLSFSFGDSGAGNFGNFPLFVGARNNATNRFPGRIYSLIVRGAPTSARQISNTERWVNSRTRAY